MAPLLFAKRYASGSFLSKEPLIRRISTNSTTLAVWHFWKSLHVWKHELCKRARFSAVAKTYSAACWMAAVPRFFFLELSALYSFLYATKELVVELGLPTLIRRRCLRIF